LKCEAQHRQFSPREKAKMSQGNLPLRDLPGPGLYCLFCEERQRRVQKPISIGYA
jgi:hypothetical protein